MDLIAPADLANAHEVAASLLTALTDRRIQATLGSFDNDIAAMREA